MVKATVETVYGIGSAAVISRWRDGRRVAAGTSLFALLLTIYGLSVTVRSAHVGDVACHVAVLVMLAVTLGLLLLPAGRRSLADR